MRELATDCRLPDHRDVAVVVANCLLSYDRVPFTVWGLVASFSWLEWANRRPLAGREN